MMQRQEHSGTLRAMPDACTSRKPASDSEALPARDAVAAESPQAELVRELQELGGPEGPEPTRFGDWERKGRCIDF